MQVRTLTRTRGPRSAVTDRQPRLPVLSPSLPRPLPRPQHRDSLLLEQHNEVIGYVMAGTYKGAHTAISRCKMVLEGDPRDSGPASVLDGRPWLEAHYYLTLGAAFWVLQMDQELASLYNKARGLVSALAPGDAKSELESRLEGMAKGASLAA